MLVVDSDPQALETIRQDGARTFYGDAEEPELIDALPLRGASWVVSTVPDRSVDLVLLHGLEHADYTGSVSTRSTVRAAGLRAVPSGSRKPPGGKSSDAGSAPGRRVTLRSRHEDLAWPACVRPHAAAPWRRALEAPPTARPLRAGCRPRR